MKKLNYLNNKDLLLEIHRSKNNFSSYSSTEYSTYDLILPSVNEINNDAIIEARKNRAKRMQFREFEKQRNKDDKIKITDININFEDIPKTCLIFRTMSFDHIPDAPNRKKNPKNEADTKVKLNFPPFQHWKFDDDENLICVGKSHWVGDLDTGHFSFTHAQATKKLALMWMKICERYATRGNVRSYCVDEHTQAFTDLGWTSLGHINSAKKILSFNNGHLEWSNIKSVYSGEYNGEMHFLTSLGLNSLVTPGHKFVTSQGLVKVEHLTSEMDLILMGELPAPTATLVKDSFFNMIASILAQKASILGEDHIEILACNESALNVKQSLDVENLVYATGVQGNKTLFTIAGDHARLISNVIKNEQSFVNFSTKMSSVQRRNLICCLAGISSITAEKLDLLVTVPSTYLGFFQILCTLEGYRTGITFKKPDTDLQQVAILARSRNKISVKQLNFHGGKVKDLPEIAALQPVPNSPTKQYSGIVWCPETEYGCFVARRSGDVFLTGNTYNDEMRGQAILQLAQVGLQFDESKSSNPFSYYTSAVKNSFVRVINSEKRNQGIRDDILEINGMNPSWTRQNRDSYKDTPSDD